MTRTICCSKCNGEGIITTKDPKDPPWMNTYTVCDECKGDGWYEYLKGFVILLVPNVLLLLS